MNEEHLFPFVFDFLVRVHTSRSTGTGKSLKTRGVTPQIRNQTKSHPLNFKLGDNISVFDHSFGCLP